MTATKPQMPPTPFELPIAYLVESSCLPATVGLSTTAQTNHVNDVVKGGTQKTSVYIRKEFISFTIKQIAFAAIVFSMHRSVRDALTILSQQFSGRNVKMDLLLLAAYLENRGSAIDPETAAEEIGRLAINTLKLFDRRFAQKIDNPSGCIIGKYRLDVDFDNLIGDLQAFYAEYGQPVPDCPINDFLGIDQETGLASDLCSHTSLEKLPPVKNLQKIVNKSSRISCNECQTIGDAVIALEQPSSVILVHLDKSFNKLCEVTGREHKQIKSVLALAKETDSPSS